MDIASHSRCARWRLAVSRVRQRLPWSYRWDDTNDGTHSGGAAYSPTRIDEMHPEGCREPAAWRRSVPEPALLRQVLLAIASSDRRGPWMGCC